MTNLRIEAINWIEERIFLSHLSGKEDKENMLRYIHSCLVDKWGNNGNVD